jgi:hypothetical protein
MFTSVKAGSDVLSGRPFFFGVVSGAQRGAIGSLMTGVLVQLQRAGLFVAASQRKFDGSLIRVRACLSREPATVCPSLLSGLRIDCSCLRITANQRKKLHDIIETRPRLERSRGA